MAYEVEDFDTQVIRRSHEVPVVVDFWASWCGPCLSFAPIIEKAAAEANGRWDLVKVNTEEQRELADRFRIRSLPTIRIFRDGEVVSEKLGAMPESVFREWVDEFAPSPGKALAEEIDRLLLAGEVETARERLEADAVTIDPLAAVRLRALIALAEAPSEVAELVGGIPLSAREHNDGLYLKALAELRLAGGEGTYGEGLDALSRLDFAQAAVKWIDSLSLNDANAGARKGLKNLFLLLGPQHPVTREHQPSFSRLAYS